MARRHLRPRPALRRPLAETGVAVMRLELVAGDDLDEHGHDVVEMAWVERGCLAHAVDGRSLPGPPGSLLLVPRGHVHRYAVRTRTCLWNVLLDPERLPPVPLPRPLERHLPRLLPGDAPLLLTGLDLADLLRRLGAEQERQALGWEAAVASLVRLLLLTAVRACAVAGMTEAPASDPRIEALRRRIEERPGEAWTLARLAQEAGLGRSGVSRAFARSTGCTPLRYVRRARLRLAAARLAAGDTLAGAAAECGYGSAAALAHARARA